MPEPSFKVWRVQQYCYFWIASEVLTAAECTAALGIVPDTVSVRGSRFTGPSTVPVEHSWQIECRRHASISEQASEVLERIRPAAGAVRKLVDRGDVDAGLMVVRYFDDPDGGYDAMGWDLTASQLGLLAEMGAGITTD